MFRTQIPKVPLNRGEHYKLLVLLTGTGVGTGVTVSGGIKDGAVKLNRRQPRPSNRVLGLVTFLALLLIAEPTVLTLGDRTPPPVGCAEGKLTVSGSTAFAPVMKEIGGAYEKECPGSTIHIEARGSGAGIASLEEAGRAAKSGAPSRIALSDGLKPPRHPRLRENQVALSIFALVLNDRVPVRDLSLHEIRKIYRGEITNWKQAGGPDLPVRLVSRDADSGTREVFQRRVLGHNEPVFSSRDCAHKDDRQAPVVRCELDTTERVLRTVGEVPGAIGYTELRSATRLRGAHRLRLDGSEPGIDAVRQRRYPFREVEYAYTYGQPAADSLTSSFLNFLITGRGQNIVSTHGHLPCAAPANQELCRRP